MNEKLSLQLETIKNFKTFMYNNMAVLQTLSGLDTDAKYLVGFVDRQAELFMEKLKTKYDGVD